MGEMMLEDICAGHEVTDQRRESLRLAIDLGADRAALIAVRDAVRVRRNSTTIVLPRERLETLSRGRGWCRQGRGSSALWGERSEDGYRVGPGHWIVCGNDGFRRERRSEWHVRHIAIGDQIWTVAS